MLMMDIVLNAEQKRLLTLEDIFHPKEKQDFEGRLLRKRTWIGGNHYLERTDDDDSPWKRFDARTGEDTTLYEPDRLKAALEGTGEISPADSVEMSRPSKHHLNRDQTAALIQHNGILVHYLIESNRAVLLDEDIDTNVGAIFSPDDRLASYVKNDNIQVTDLQTGKPFAITKGSGGSILSGCLDWVYQEEIYGRDNFTGYWWSPDATRVAFLELDTSQVSKRRIIDHTSEGNDLEIRYPRAGEPNPRVRLGVVNVPDGEVRWIDTSPYASIDHLIVRVAWNQDGSSLFYQVQDREQQWLDLARADPDTGQSVAVMRETSQAWIQALDDPYWLEDGSFLWLSERSGRKHIHHYGTDSRLKGSLTSGDWDVIEIYGVDAGHGWIYFSSTEHSPMASHVYRVRLDGRDRERLTHSEGTHTGSFSKTFRFYIDTWSSVSTPPEISLRPVPDEKGDAGSKTLETHLVQGLDTYEWGTTEYIEVTSRDGLGLPAMMIKPPNFDPNRQYPVLCHVYGGPMAPKVSNAWGGELGAWHNMLAQRGCIVWISDNRSSSGRGVASSWPIYRRFGELELADIEDGITWLKSQRYVDPERFGIWGWSFGGYLTAYAMTHSTLFRMGIAGAPVTDWNLYDSIYTERYMAKPSTNVEGYRNSSVLAAADQLHGKLLILHGTMDDNVHIEHSMRLIRELQRAGKDFQTMFYPQSKHKIEDPDQRYHMHRVMTDFVLENL